MLEIPARRVLIDPEVYRRPNCAERLARVLPHVRCDDVSEMSAEDYRAVFDIRKRRHGKDDFGDDCTVVFTTFDEGRLGWYYHFREAQGVYRSQGGFCQTALELNLIDGCVFRCAYCGFGRFIVFYLDVERLIAGLDEQFARHGDQRLYKYSNMTDLPPFEPELDVVRPMVERFAREADRYCMLFTKSDNVDFLLDLEHRGHTIVSWSLSSQTVSRLVDRRTADMDGRIAAMARCQAAGYPVRARLSPIVPVRNWRQEYRQCLETLFAACRPDVVTLELLGWFDFEDLGQLLPVELLDEQAYAAARDAAERLRGVNWGPFTQATHEEVYRFCIETVHELAPGTPVSFCHGTVETWRSLGSLTGMTPETYLCNCGAMSTPGGELYERMRR